MSGTGAFAVKRDDLLLMGLPALKAMANGQTPTIAPSYMVLAAIKTLTDKQAGQQTPQDQGTIKDQIMSKTSNPYQAGIGQMMPQQQQFARGGYVQNYAGGGRIDVEAQTQRNAVLQKQMDDQRAAGLARHQQFGAQLRADFDIQQQAQQPYRGFMALSGVGGNAGQPNPSGGTPSTGGTAAQQGATNGIGSSMGSGSDSRGGQRFETNATTVGQDPYSQQQAQEAMMGASRGAMDQQQQVRQDPTLMQQQTRHGAGGGMSGYQQREQQMIDARNAQYAQNGMVKTVQNGVGGQQNAVGTMGAGSGGQRFENNATTVGADPYAQQQAQQDQMAAARRDEQAQRAAMDQQQQAQMMQQRNTGRGQQDQQSQQDQMAAARRNEQNSRAARDQQQQAQMMQQREAQRAQQNGQQMRPPFMGGGQQAQQMARQQMRTGAQAGIGALGRGTPPGMQMNRSFNPGAGRMGMYEGGQVGKKKVEGFFQGRGIPEYPAMNYDFQSDPTRFVRSFRAANDDASTAEAMFNNDNYSNEGGRTRTEPPSMPDLPIPEITIAGARASGQAKSGGVPGAGSNPVAKYKTGPIVLEGYDKSKLSVKELKDIADLSPPENEFLKAALLKYSQPDSARMEEFANNKQQAVLGALASGLMRGRGLGGAIGDAARDVVTTGNAEDKERRADEDRRERIALQLGLQKGTEDYTRFRDNLANKNVERKLALDVDSLNQRTGNDVSSAQNANALAVAGVAQKDRQLWLEERKNALMGAAHALNIEIRRDGLTQRAEEKKQQLYADADKQALTDVTKLYGLDGPMGQLTPGRMQEAQKMLETLRSASHALLNKTFGGAGKMAPPPPLAGDLADPNRRAGPGQ